MTVSLYVWYYYAYEPLVQRTYTLEEQSCFQKEEDVSQKIAALRTKLTVSDATSEYDLLEIILGYIDQASMTLEHAAQQDKQLYIQAAGTYHQCIVLFDAIASASQRLLPRDLRIIRGADNQFSVSCIIE